MEARFFTPQKLQQWAQEDSPQLLEAALLQITQLQQRSGQLKEARAQLKLKDARIVELETLLETAQRAALRQAAPFRVPEQKRVATRKVPGRKAGHPGACRPCPAQIDEDLTVELSDCPHCGSPHWIDEQEIEQFIEEIPQIRPRVTRLRTYEAACARCGQRTGSRHPLQVSQATGAAAVHLGPRALAIAADLNKAKGLSMRKTCAVLQDHFGLRLTAGGLSQALMRVAAQLEPRYDELGRQLLNAPSIHVDETSWWVGGCLAWLWVFAHPSGTYYVVDKNRSRAVLERVVGEVFPGSMVTDCLSVYDGKEGVQQKCYSHHLKAIRLAKDIHPQKGEGFLNEIGALLRRALELGKQKAAGPVLTFEEQLLQLQHEADALLAQPHEHAAEQAVCQRLLKQRDHLFTFLTHEGVDATNNLAERQLRPAVIARKISCGNKTPAGATAFQILASLAATCHQIGSSFIDLIAQDMPLDSG